MSVSRRIRMRHLEAFIEVARQKSVGRAAITLSLTQPAVTRTIRELEEIVDARLVEPDGRGIKLSPQGEVFLSHAGSGLAAVRKGIAALANVGTVAGPPVLIGALPTVSATMMPGAVAEFLESGVKSPLRVISGENRVLLDQLRKGDLDLVMGRMPAPELMTSLSFEPLYRDRVVFIVSKTHPLAGERQVASDVLANYPVLVPPPGSIIHPFVERLMIEQGMAPPLDAVETVSDSFGRAYLRASDAIWIISRGVVAAEIDLGEFVELPIDTGSTLGSVGLITRENDRPHDAAVFFADILRRRAALN